MRPPRFRADRAPWYLRCWPLARSGDRRGGLVLRRGGAARRLHSRGAGHSPCPDCAAPMTFAFTLLSLSASGLAVLHLARLQTGRFTVDLPLAWFVGSGWFALGAMTLRFVGSVPYSRAAVIGILLAPVFLWTATRAVRRRTGAARAQRSGT